MRKPRCAQPALGGPEWRLLHPASQPPRVSTPQAHLADSWPRGLFSPCRCLPQLPHPNHLLPQERTQTPHGGQPEQLLGCGEKQVHGSVLFTSIKRRLLRFHWTAWRVTICQASEDKGQTAAIPTSPYSREQGEGQSIYRKEVRQGTLPLGSCARSMTASPGFCPLFGPGSCHGPHPALPSKRHRDVWPCLCAVHVCTRCT